MKSDLQELPAYLSTIYLQFTKTQSSLEAEASTIQVNLEADKSEKGKR